MRKKILRETVGNTPALAGKMGSVILLISAIWEHPRSRGEDNVKPTFLAKSLGTPPLSRGRSCRSQSTWYETREHPRSRGEDSLLMKDEASP